MQSASQLPASTARAYLVRFADDPEQQVIRFARYNTRARREGAALLDCDPIQVTCTREPWADAFAESRIIPAQAYIANGWYVSCRCCGRMVGDDSSDDDGCPLNLIYEGREVFCNAECQEVEHGQRVMCARLKQQVIDATLAKFPGVTIINGSEHTLERWCDFTFPGGLGRVIWRLGEETVSVHARDVAAWEAFVATLRVERAP
ncbi:hypothetical protein [Pseudomonas sp. PS01301]|uniref:hypothetical protein n=1 Tax=Pseudomonas sp. PS01301 TaxID=2991437 RepID=UPI00249C2697|nr:hypothetical protein [Pseudomonas sp. PS01301]